MPRSQWRQGVRRSASLLCGAVPLLLAWLLPQFTSSATRPVLLDLGPNDTEYARGLRSDWERDGTTIFHWTGVTSRVELPLLISGAGHVLRLRARRHFLEPAQVTVTCEGRTVASFRLSAESSRDPGQPYVVLEFPLPPLEGRHHFALDIEAPSESPRPLGLALDWIEIERAGEGACSQALATRVRLVLAVAATLVLLLAAGLTPGRSCVAATTLLAGGLFGFVWDPMAAERILRLGLATYLLTGVVALAVCVAARWERLDEEWRPSLRGVLVALVLLAVAVRLVLLLHPRFYYPDVRVHAIFARELAKTGLSTFMQEFTANQYRFSLGLQNENGHWYAFPYPPLFYMLTWPLIRVLRYAPEVAVALVPAAMNSLEVVLVFGLARRLTKNLAWSVAAAATVPLLPIFIARLSLAYFPALVGHFFDTLLLWFLVTHWERIDERRRAIGAALLLAIALLAYTQSLLNFGVLLPLFLALQMWKDSTPAGRRRQVALFAAGLLGVSISFLFYGRYIPVFVDMQRGVPQAEERILLEKQAQAPRDQPPQVGDDPFAGPGVDLARGAAKAAWRLYVFYWWFAPLIVVGVLLAIRQAPTADMRRLVAVWGLVYLLLNLASGGLPGPNLVRYNKDLEVVAPLTCIGLALVWSRLAVWNKWLARVGVASFAVFAAQRAVQYLSQRFFLDRSSGL